jgi:hypothetical protein
MLLQIDGRRVSAPYTPRAMEKGRSAVQAVCARNGTMFLDMKFHGVLLSIKKGRHGCNNRLHDSDNLSQVLCPTTNLEILEIYQG